VNNDGKLEFFIYSRYYEGMGYSLYEINNGKAESLLGAGMGV
jgi:hypothetical protein